MLDFYRRINHASRESRRWFVWIFVTQTLTAIGTGAAIGYVTMFPVVLAFAMAQEPSRGLSQRDQTQYDRQRRSGAEIVRHAQHKTLVYRVLDAFDDDVMPAEQCVNANVVLGVTSLLATIGVAIGLVAATYVERRRLRRDGGWALALAIGGRHLEDPTQASERQLVNVVEEMAIAMNTVAPTVFVLDQEPGINVFAAGLTPEDSILGVTAGALQHFKRDELQAVVAHEFSHLVSGDTCLGTRLTAALYALNGIQVVAETVFHFGRDISDSESESFVGGYALMLLAIVTWPFGAFGAIAAHGLTMAVTRSREWMADANAVRATRHPVQLARALRRILGHPQRGKLQHPASVLVAPMLFVDRHNRGCLFSTHPQIQDRILAIDPAGGSEPIYASVIRPQRGVDTPATAKLIDELFAGFSSLVPVMAASHNGSREPEAESPDPVLTPDPASTMEAALVVLSMISGCDGDNTMADYEFMRGWLQLGVGEVARIPPSEIAEEDFDAALAVLAKSPPSELSAILTAIANTISADSETSLAEAELMKRIQARLCVA